MSAGLGCRADSSWTDVYATDGSIRYKVTNDGDGYEHPAACDDVWLKFTGTDENGNIVQQQVTLCSSCCL